MNTLTSISKISPASYAHQSVLLSTNYLCIYEKYSHKEMSKQSFISLNHMNIFRIVWSVTYIKIGEHNLKKGQTGATLVNLTASDWPAGLMSVCPCVPEGQWEDQLVLMPSLLRYLPGSGLFVTTVATWAAGSANTTSRLPIWTA